VVKYVEQEFTTLEVLLVKKQELKKEDASIINLGVVYAYKKPQPSWGFCCLKSHIG
jgi:hypothetical protein